MTKPYIRIVGKITKEFISCKVINPTTGTVVEVTGPRDKEDTHRLMDALLEQQLKVT